VPVPVYCADLAAGRAAGCFKARRLLQGPQPEFQELSDDQLFF